MAIVEGKAGYDRDYDAQVRTSGGTLRQLRHLAVLNTAIVVAAGMIALLIALRVNQLPDLDGQTVRMSRIDLELTLFKGYSARQVFMNSPAECTWFQRDSCGSPYALRGLQRTYRCIQEFDANGGCKSHYTCRPHRC